MNTVSPPAATTPKVVGELVCSRLTADSKLEDLAEERCIETEKVGTSGRIWWRPVDVEVAESSPGQVAAAANDGLETRLAAGVIEELLRAMPIAISVRDSGGETLRANDRARDLLGPLDRGGGVVPFEEVAGECAVRDVEGTRHDHRTRHPQLSHPVHR